MTFLIFSQDQAAIATGLRWHGPKIGVGEPWWVIVRTCKVKKLRMVLIALILAAHKQLNWPFLVRMVRPKGLNDWFQSGSCLWASEKGQTEISGLILVLQKPVYDFKGILTTKWKKSLIWKNPLLITSPKYHFYIPFSLLQRKQPYAEAQGDFLGILVLGFSTPKVKIL